MCAHFILLFSEDTFCLCVCLFVCAVPASTATIKMNTNADQIYHKVNTEYVDPGATATVISSDGTSRDTLLFASLNTVPTPCETTGQYTVEYGFSWPGCQCCSCQLNESLSKNRSVKAEQTVIVCTYNMFTKAHASSLSSAHQVYSSRYLVQTIRYRSRPSATKWCGTSKARLTLTVEQSPRLVTVVAYGCCNMTF